MESGVERRRLLDLSVSDRVLLIASVVWALFLYVVYRWQPDALAALTFWPVWGWTVVGLLLLLPVLRRSWREALLVVVVWILVVGHSANETRGLRRLLCVDEPGPHPLRVVTLNCAGGSVDAAREVIGYAPDLVLLQEVPARADCEALARELFGPGPHCVWGVDNAILARWPLTPVDVPEHHFVAATFQPGADKYLVISLRLSPPSLPVALWRPSAWTTQAALRRLRRDELAMVVQTIRSCGVPAVLGGDFNAPARDGIFRAMPEGYREAYAIGGRGWGDTVLNDLPVARFDQIWQAAGLAASNVRAMQTEHSDHRLVVADLWRLGRGW